MRAKSICRPALSILCVLAMTGPVAALERFERTLTVEQAISGTETVRVENLLGSIRLKAGAAPGTVQVRAQVVSEAKTEARARELAGTIRIRNTSDRGAPTLHVAFPTEEITAYRLPKAGAKGMLGRWTAPVLKRKATEIDYAGRAVEVRSDRKATGLAVHLTVTVPYDVKASIYQAVGSVSGRGLRGAFDLETVNGEVEIQQSFGDLEVRAKGGSVAVSTYQGERLRIETDEANVTLEDVRVADAGLRTTGGSIRTAGLEARGLDVDSAYGPVTLDGVNATEAEITTDSAKVDFASQLKGARNTAIRTASGDVTLRFGMQTKFTLLAETKSGSVKTLGMQLESLGQDGAVGTFQRGGGGPQVEVHAAGGDVTVRPYGASRLDLMIGKTGE